MAGRFLQTYITPDVLAAQTQYYGRRQIIPPQPERDLLGPEEAAFIAVRDSFYIATISSDGWPYIQHRGGPPGFLKLLDEHTVGFADFKGNRQLLSTGNLTANDRVSLFLMDYPQRTRLKLMGHARTLDARDHSELADQLSPTPELRKQIERFFFIDIVSYDWNCPKYITPRFTAAEINEAVAPLKQRIAELEAQLKARNP
jgi:predicted pyridoxine 5'-phosphate oxidase superfamily flavin-nucleotide-binding protein